MFCVLFFILGEHLSEILTFVSKEKDCFFYVLCCFFYLGGVTIVYVQEKGLNVFLCFMFFGKAATAMHWWHCCRPSTTLGIGMICIFWVRPPAWSYNIMYLMIFDILTLFCWILKLLLALEWSAYPELDHLHNNISPYFGKIFYIAKGSRQEKNGLFTVRLTVRGGRGGQPPRPWPYYFHICLVSKCENFGPVVK